MMASILVATPHAAFGELLKSSLEDSGLNKVETVHTGKEARSASSRGNFQLAIVDSAIRDQTFVPLCIDLQAQQANLRLIIVPPDNNPNHPALGGLMPHGYLTRPFYLPDLIDTVTRLLKERSDENQTMNKEKPETQPANAMPAWLQEPLNLTRYLEQELPITQALAGIVGMNGTEPRTGSLRANAGRLSAESASELASTVFRYWSRNDKADLMRFVRLKDEKQDYLIYATEMIGDLLLILVYETSAPLSMIRPQTKTLAHMLATLPPTTFNPAFKVVRTAGAEPPNQVEKAGYRSPMSVRLLPHEPAEQPTVDQPAVVDQHAETRAVPDQPVPFHWDSPVVKEPAKKAQPQETPPSEANLHKSAIWEPMTEPVPDNSPAARSIENELADDLQDDDDAYGGAVINLQALLGSIPEPDPDLESHAGPLPTPGASGKDIPRINRPGNRFSSWQPSSSLHSEPAPTPPASNGQNDQLPVTNSAFNVDTELPAPSAEIPPVKQQAANQEERRKTQEWLDSISRQAGAGSSPPSKPLPPAEPAVLPEWMRDFVPPAQASAPPVYEPAAQSDSSGFYDSIDLSPAAKKPVKPAFKPQQRTGRPGKPIFPEIQDSHAMAYGLPVGKDADGESDSAGALILQPERPIDPLEDTKPRVMASITHINQLEPVSPALSLLNYTCVLVPRLPQHYLTSEVADRLSQWVHQMCLAFGWRLEGIAIRPEYLQWTVQVAPSVAPGNLMRIIRQRTSLNIFTHFTILSEQNPSGDFWATGYLIVSGSQPPSPQLLREYIAQTRKRQGVSR